jgi:aspartate/methionine/tyrosine aminotransferase
VKIFSTVCPEVGGAAESPTAGLLTTAALDAAAARARAAGHRVRGIILTSPCNPRGSLHSRSEIEAVERFVLSSDGGEKDGAGERHLIWDAVYAGTAFDEAAAAAAAPRLPPSDRHRMHTVWGLAKDFGTSTPFLSLPPCLPSTVCPQLSAFSCPPSTVCLSQRSAL